MPLRREVLLGAGENKDDEWYRHVQNTYLGRALETTRN